MRRLRSGQGNGGAPVDGWVVSGRQWAVQWQHKGGQETGQAGLACSGQQQQHCSRSCLRIAGQLAAHCWWHMFQNKPHELTRGGQQLRAVADGCNGLARLHKVFHHFNNLGGSWAQLWAQQVEWETAVNCK